MLNKQTASMIISVLVNKNETPGFYFAFPIDNSNHSSLGSQDKYFESSL